MHRTGTSIREWKGERKSVHFCVTPRVNPRTVQPAPLQMVGKGGKNEANWEPNSTQGKFNRTGKSEIGSLCAAWEVAPCFGFRLTGIRVFVYVCDCVWTCGFRCGYSRPLLGWSQGAGCCLFGCKPQILFTVHAHPCCPVGTKANLHRHAVFEGCTAVVWQRLGMCASRRAKALYCTLTLTYCVSYCFQAG